MKNLSARFIFNLFTLALFSLNAFAQTAPASAVTAEMRAEANKLYQAQDWQKAADAYENISKLEPKNPNAHYRAGNSLLHLDKNADAVGHLEKAMEIAPNAIFAQFLAKAYARTGNKKKAYEVLDKSLGLGGISPDALSSDKDFDAIKAEQRFKDLLQKEDVAANPCKASPEFRQFDFWIGEWDARNPQGVTVGSSSIQLILGSCVIFENWSTPVSNGKSFNVYNAADKKWHQTYVDDKNTFAHYIGELKDGKMVYVAENITNGKKTLARMTFSKLPTGEVRQFGENSDDDGKTWTPTFDLTYSRKKS
jgi:tetratricopeptide (TPR) repeat protein